MYILPHPGRFASDAGPPSSSTNIISTLKRRVSTLARAIVTRKKGQEAISTHGLRRMSISSHSSSQTCSTDATLVDDPDRVPVALFRASRRLSAQVEPVQSAQPSSTSPSPRPSVQLERRLSLAEMRARALSPPPPPTSYKPPTESCPAPPDRRLTLAEMRASWSGPPSSYVPPRPTPSLPYPRSSEMPARPRSLHGPSSFDASYSCWDPRRASLSLSPSTPASIQPAPSTPSNVPADVSGTVPASTMRRQLSISFADEASLVQRGEDAQRRRSSARTSSMRAAGHTRRATSVIRRAASEPAVIALSEPAAIAPSQPAVIAPQATAVAASHSSASAPQASAVPNIGWTRTRRFFVSRPKSWSGKKTLSTVNSTSPPSLKDNASDMKRQSSIAPVYVAAVGMVVNVA